MCEKREKPSQAEAVPFISIMRNLRPGELTQLRWPEPGSELPLLPGRVPSTVTHRRHEPSREGAKNLKYFRCGNKMHL